MAEYVNAEEAKPGMVISEKRRSGKGEATVTIATVDETDGSKTVVTTTDGRTFEYGPETFLLKLN